MVGACFSCKTYLMLRSFSKLPNRDNYIVTRSPPEQYFNSKIKTKKIGEQMKPPNEDEIDSIVFDYILGSTNSR